MKLWRIKSEIRQVVFSSLKDKLDIDTLNEVTNEITDKLYKSVNLEGGKQMIAFLKEQVKNWKDIEIFLKKGE